MYMQYTYTNTNTHTHIYIHGFSQLLESKNLGGEGLKLRTAPHIPE